MPDRDPDIRTDLGTLLERRRQLQLACRRCGYWRVWHGRELAGLIATVGNVAVGDLRPRARCSQCGLKGPRAIIDFADHRTRRSPRHRTGTLGDILRQGRCLTFHCERLNCGHHAQADLAALVRRLGEGYPLQRLLERCSCTRCAARWPQVGLQAPPGER